MSDVNNVFYLDSQMNAHASQSIKGLLLVCIAQRTSVFTDFYDKKALYGLYYSQYNIINHFICSKMQMTSVCIQQVLNIFQNSAWIVGRRLDDNFLRLLPLLIMPLFSKKKIVSLGFYYYFEKLNFAKPCKLLETLASFPKFSL